MIAADGDIPGTVHEEEFTAQVLTGMFLFLHGPDALAESNLKAFRSPWGILPQAEEYRHSVFTRLSLFAEGQRIHRRSERSHIGFNLPAGDFFSVPGQHRHAAEG